MKVFANTALGHFVVGLLTTLGLAAVSYIVNDSSAAATLVSFGVPITIVKLVVDLIRSQVPNL